jgi:ABC-type Fe3+-hydroxamate transport system substrate-binding protein
MITSTDQLNRTISLADFPRRIISVVPSQTQLLFSLGLSNEVAGITKFCIHPDLWFRTKTRVGGTKKLNIEKIREINPDLIIANHEENSKQDIDALSEHFLVWISDIKNLDDALSMIREVGFITNRNNEAAEICNQIGDEFDMLRSHNMEYLKAIYLIWKNPFLTVGGDTFISSMMKEAGFTNMMSGISRYPEISIDEIQELSPDIVLLSSEPFPFKPKDAEELRESLKDIEVSCVDGEKFSWYGSALISAPQYFLKLRTL